MNVTDFVRFGIPVKLTAQLPSDPVSHASSVPLFQEPDTAAPSTGEPSIVRVAVTAAVHVLPSLVLLPSSWRT